MAECAVDFPCQSRQVIKAGDGVTVKVKVRIGMMRVSGSVGKKSIAEEANKDGMRLKGRTGNSLFSLACG